MHDEKLLNIVIVDLNKREIQLKVHIFLPFYTFLDSLLDGLI
jgi:hypothetical protein